MITNGHGPPPARPGRPCRSPSVPLSPSNYRNFPCIPPQSVGSVNLAPGLLMRLRPREARQSGDPARPLRGERPTDRPTGRVGGRETCVYRKRTFPLAMSIAYCQRRTRRTPPHAHAHEYCPGPTQLRLDSCSCVHPNEKVCHHDHPVPRPTPSFTFRASQVAMNAPYKFLTLPSLLAPF